MSDWCKEPCFAPVELVDVGLGKFNQRKWFYEYLIRGSNSG
jgi:hypothetical protein